MTVSFATNSNDDIFLGSDGNITVVSGLQAVLMACANAAKSQLGEMVLAINNGVPNFQTVWVGSPNLAIFQSYLRKALESIDGVIAVTALSANYVNDVLSYTAKISSIYGPGEING